MYVLTLKRGMSMHQILSHLPTRCKPEKKNKRRHGRTDNGKPKPTIFDFDGSLYIFSGCLVWDLHPLVQFDAFGHKAK